jgi:hypothetical protein
MKYRKLRIAWSVGWGVVAVLLCVLWIRSYWYCDHIGYSGIAVSHNFGVVQLVSVPTQYSGWIRLATPFDEGDLRVPAFYYDGDSWTNYCINAPYWILILGSATIAAVPWLRVRYSLRTLLIATTFIAVLLGMIVWMSRAA